MLTNIKSLYGRICVILVAAMWTLYFAQSIVGMLLIFAPPGWRRVLSTTIAMLLVALVAKYLWPRVSHLGVESVVNSTKGTVAIFLLTVSLIAFPGTLLIPLAYASLTDRPNTLLYAWYSLFGVPLFIVLSIVGLVLVYNSRLRKVRNDASQETPRK